MRQEWRATAGGRGEFVGGLRDFVHEHIAHRFASESASTANGQHADTDRADTAAAGLINL